MRKAYCINLVGEKIKALNAVTKSIKEMLRLLKKDYIYLGLKKKYASGLWDSFFWQY